MKTYYLSFSSWCGAVEIKAVNLKEAKVRAKKYACVSRFPKGYKLTCNAVELNK